MAYVVLACLASFSVAYNSTYIDADTNISGDEIAPRVYDSFIENTLQDWYEMGEDVGFFIVLVCFVILLGYIFNMFKRWKK